MDIYIMSLEEKAREALLEPVDDDMSKKLFETDYLPLEEVSMFVSEGSVFYDVIGFQNPSGFCVNEKTINLFESNGLTGYKTYPISVADNQIKLFGIYVYGKSGGVIPPKKIGFYKGVNIDMEQWDNSDFFIPAESQHVMLTAKAAAVFVENKISNVEIINLKEKRMYYGGR